MLVVSAPFVALLCATLWRTPFPVSEAVALLEDVAKSPPQRFLAAETSYYRPLFHLTLSAIWHGAEGLDDKLAAIRLLHIVPVIVLVTLFVSHLRPRSAVDAAAAAAAVVVLIGSPGFADNLEIPLSYTIVGMPAALAVWMLLNREPRAWHGPAIVLLALLAVGFKEQGLVIVPLVLVASSMGAPGSRRSISMTLVAMTTAYVMVRLRWRGELPLFEQALGLGFDVVEPRDAAARFRAFPYWVFAYNSASTVANVLFSEPTSGVFRILRSATTGTTQAWEIVHLASSAGLTGAIAWWGVRSLRRDRAARWSFESRLFAAFIAVLLACGALSFDYSRDRLGGMAAVFYALAAYHALRAAVAAAAEAGRPRFVVAGVALVVLTAAWNIRAAATIERVRLTAWRNQLEWLTELPRRRLEFADRPEYLEILESMVERGTNPSGPLPTRYSPWIARTLGVPVLE